MKNIRKSSSRSFAAALFCAVAGPLAGICFAAGTPAPSPAATAKSSPAPSPSRGASPSGSPAAAEGLQTGATDGHLEGISITASVGSSDMGVDVVGRIGNIEIKAEDLKASIAALDPATQAAVSSNPAAMKLFLTSLLVERVMLQEIAAKKYDQQATVEEYLKRKRDFELSQLYLNSITQPPDNYPSDEKLNDAYEARKSAFMAPSEFQVAQIFIAIPPKPDQAALDKAKAKLAAIVSSLNAPNADFGAVAHDQSDDTKSGANDGLMGWLNRESMPPRIRYQALMLPINAISPPIMLDDGLHIIKVIASKNPQPLKFDDVKVKLAKQLRAERTQANMKEYVDKLMAQNPVSINDIELSNLAAKPGK